METRLDLSGMNHVNFSTRPEQVLIFHLDVYNSNLVSQVNLGLVERLSLTLPIASSMFSSIPSSSSSMRSTVRISLNPQYSSSLNAQQPDIGEVWTAMVHNVCATLIEMHGFSSVAKDDPCGREGNIIWVHLFLGAFSLLPRRS